MNQQHSPDTGLKDLIMAQVRNAERRYTPVDLERTLFLEHRVPVKNVRKTIKELLAENRLVYTHLLGHSFLEISYRRPVPVGGGVVLAPADVPIRPAPGQTWIRIAPGAAFGMGDHATTRLSLQLMEWSMREQGLLAFASGTRALDIGTGSGVLAIGACLMGAAEAVGTDLDACARVEASENVRINGLEHRIQIAGSDLEAIAGPFSLILANLRYPTLIAMHDRILQLCEPRAVLIFSGFREHELPGLLAAYASHRVAHLRTRIENGWAGIVLALS